MSTTLPLGHLSRRFFQVLRPAPLSPIEQGAVSDVLPAAEAELFFLQTAADQRHAYLTWQRVAASCDDPVVHRAALLHDVGKIVSRVGAVGRVIATLLDAAGLPMPRRLRSYRRHGTLGASLLDDAGSPPLVVDFARRHPERDPGRHAEDAWRALLDADHA